MFLIEYYQRYHSIVMIRAMYCVSMYYVVPPTINCCV